MMTCPMWIWTVVGILLIVLLIVVICDTHDLGLTSWRDFANLFKVRSESGRGASPDSFFPSFRPAVAELTIGGPERSVI